MKGQRGRVLVYAGGPGRGRNTAPAGGGGKLIGGGGTSRGAGYPSKQKPQLQFTVRPCVRLAHRGMALGPIAARLYHHSRASSSNPHNMSRI